MTLRNVDVMDKTGRVLKTYPITIDTPGAEPKDADFAKAAMVAAKASKLVPEGQFGKLRTRIHPAARG